jgi:ribosomal protein S18 acetylase RimI-like enzyme
MSPKTKDLSMLTNRPVQEVDISTICQFPRSELELFFMFPKATYPLTVNQLKDAIAQRTDSTVVLMDGRVVGFANFYVCEPGEKCAIGNVIVAPDARGQGVGQYLIETMVQIALTQYQAKEVRISCFNQNVSGLLLYQKLGFRPFEIESRIDKQGNRVASIHMKLSRPVVQH